MLLPALPCAPPRIAFIRCGGVSYSATKPWRPRPRCLMSLQAKLASPLHRLARLFARSSEPARAPKGWQPIGATDAADIFIVAYPKSGITWLQNMVAAAIFGVDPQQTPDG